MILVIEKGGGWKGKTPGKGAELPPCEEQTCQKGYLLESCPESLPGEPLSSHQPQQRALPKSFVLRLSRGFGAQSQKLTQLLEERGKEKKNKKARRLSAVFIFFSSCLHGFLF